MNHLKWVAALSLVGTTGCSFCFVRGPNTEPSQVDGPPRGVQAAPPDPGDCVSGKAAPIVDTLIGGYQVVRTAYALSADDSVYKNTAINRETDVAVGVALTALFLGSAIYGYVVTSKCSKAKAAEKEYLLEHQQPAPWPGPQPAPYYPPPSPPVPAATAPAVPAAPPSAAPPSPSTQAAPAVTPPPP